MRDMIGDVTWRGACVSYANIRISGGKERQSADVRGWKVAGWRDRGMRGWRTGQRRGSILRGMIDEVLQFVRGGRSRVGVGGGQFVREGKL